MESGLEEGIWRSRRVPQKWGQEQPHSFSYCTISQVSTDGFGKGTAHRIPTILLNLNAILGESAMGDRGRKLSGTWGGG